MHYTTDTWKIPDGNVLGTIRLTVAHVLALHQQEGETPMVCFRLQVDTQQTTLPVVSVLFVCLFESKAIAGQWQHVTGRGKVL